MYTLEKTDRMFSRLLALSPLDGRYHASLGELASRMSEYALIRARVKVEVEWFKKLSQLGLPEFRPLSPDTHRALTSIVEGFSPEEAAVVKCIETDTKHDVKAVEYYVKQKVGNRTNPSFLHFGCTSEDISSIAYALMVRDAQQDVLEPLHASVTAAVRTRARAWASLVIPGRTHGQLATPTTLGKELANYVPRLEEAARAVRDVKPRAKFSGAVGNWNAHYCAYPKVDWQAVSREFVEGLGVQFNGYTTQIEPHDWLADLFHGLVRHNTVMLGMNQNLWSYVSNGALQLKTVATETGSSTMPHKVNPIDFENAEGNLGIANALLTHMAQKLPVSRYQRDLTDSTVLRNIGPALGYCVLAYKSTLAGLEKTSPSVTALSIDEQWILLGEPVQTCLRKAGCDDAYERVKDWSRGCSHIDRGAYRDFILSACPELSAGDRAMLLSLTPRTYVGIAAQLALTV